MVLRHILDPGMEIYAALRPEPAQELLARLRRWIDTHTDQVIIIIVSVVLGFWLVANPPRWGGEYRRSSKRESGFPLPG